MFRAFLIVIFVFNPVIFSQQTDDSKKERFDRGNEIVRQAKNSAGFSEGMKSFQLSLHRISYSEAQSKQPTSDFQIEITILPDNKIRVFSKYDENSGTTQIWNGKKFRQTAEFVGADGKRNIIDTTDGIQFGENISKALKPKSKAPKSDFSRFAMFSESLWGLVFPLVFIHPVENSSEFEYIGRVQAGEQIAKLVQTTSKSGHLIQLFFEEKTGNLLLLAEKYKEADKEFENKYYYTTREKRDGVLIPTKVKIERKVTAKGESPDVSYVNIDLSGFETNRKLDEKIFDIK